LTRFDADSTGGTEVIAEINTQQTSRPLFALRR
jgi:hypothetical protein